MKETIGIIGYGNMGAAIAGRIRERCRVFVFDKDAGKTKNAAGLGVAESSVDLVGRADAVLLAVKPQDFGSMLSEIKTAVDKKLIISIAAGIQTDAIESFLGPGARVIRVMPNLGAQIGEAESSLCKGKSAREQDLAFARALFDAVGKTYLMEERMIDAATAIAGSGPAYIFYDLEKNKIDPQRVPDDVRQRYIHYLQSAAVSVGFDPATAHDLAAATTGTSLHLAAVPGMTPAGLRAQVTSPGGTTAAALEVLAKGGTWEAAAQAAKKRAGELAKKLDFLG